MEKKMQIIGAVSEQHFQQLKRLSDFCEADSLEYRDEGNAELILLSRNGKTLKLKACSNKYDGGFFSIEAIANIGFATDS